MIKKVSLCSATGEMSLISSGVVLGSDELTTRKASVYQ